MLLVTYWDLSVGPSGEEPGVFTKRTFKSLTASEENLNDALMGIK